MIATIMSKKLVKAGVLLWHRLVDSDRPFLAQHFRHCERSTVGRK